MTVGHNTARWALRPLGSLGRWPVFSARGDAGGRYEHRLEAVARAGGRDTGDVLAPRTERLRTAGEA